MLFYSTIWKSKKYYDENVQYFYAIASNHMMICSDKMKKIQITVNSR